jgi:hypothetical protein
LLIKALITADEYFSFALAYIVGFALLFQLPLIILFINRIKPLRPSGMMKAQRYVILFSFIAAAILTPTPDPMNQFIMAVPLVILYQISIVIIWLSKRKQDFTQIKTPQYENQIFSESAAVLHAPVPKDSPVNSSQLLPKTTSYHMTSRGKSVSGIVSNSSPCLDHKKEATTNSALSSRKDDPRDQLSPNSAVTPKLIDIMA